MSGPPPAALVLLLSLALRATAADPVLPPDPGAFFAQRIRPLLQQNCWRCHGPDKQRSGLRLDSREAVLRGGRTTVVVPGHPEASRLIDAVGYDDADLQMPPDGRLQDDEIADLATWVRLGVPWAARAEPPHPDAVRRWWAWTGRLHPLLIHFPIALILAAALAEGLVFWTSGRKPEKSGGFRRTACFCLLPGAVIAVLAALCGWSAAASASASVALAWHRGLGIAVAVLALTALVLVPPSPRPGLSQSCYRAALVLAALLILPLGHLGGGLVHGPGWLDLPW